MEWEGDDRREGKGERGRGKGMEWDRGKREMGGWKGSENRDWSNVMEGVSEIEGEGREI
jgi:hypothetical protein